MTGPGDAMKEAPLGPPIFIGGMMKSGTSLVRALLGKHPSIFASFETHWFTFASRGWRDASSQRQMWLRGLFDVDESVCATLRKDARSGVDFFERFMAHCTRRAGKRRWVEKTPDNVRHLDTIWRHWPTALFIHVRRDFRDIYASWKRNRKRTLPEFLESAEATYRGLGPLLGATRPNYLEVRYEDLVHEPKKTMEAILAFVGEPWIDGIEHNDGDNDEYERVLDVVGTKSTTALSLKRPIFTDSIGQWADVLTPAEARDIETRLAPYMLP